jgi:hypothetical protein
MRSKLPAAVALALLCAHAGAGEPHRFKGKMVQDGKTGLTIMGEQKDGIVIVTSLRHHYSLVLPWGVDWTLTEDDGALLKGSAGLVNLTLSAEESDESPERQLQGVKARLAEPGRVKGLEKLELITHRKEPVLRNVVDGEKASGSRDFRGVKVLNLFAAKRWGKVAYLLHLSRVIPSREAASFEEKALLNYATAGFQVDFMRDEAKR